MPSIREKNKVYYGVTSILILFKEDKCNGQDEDDWTDSDGVWFFGKLGSWAMQPKDSGETDLGEGG